MIIGSHAEAWGYEKASQSLQLTPPFRAEKSTVVNGALALKPVKVMMFHKLITLFLKCLLMMMLFLYGKIISDFLQLVFTY